MFSIEFGCYDGLNFTRGQVFSSVFFILVFATVYKSPFAFVSVGGGESTPLGECLSSAEQDANPPSCLASGILSHFLSKLILSWCAIELLHLFDIAGLCFETLLSIIYNLAPILHSRLLFFGTYSFSNVFVNDFYNVDWMFLIIEREFFF